MKRFLVRNKKTQEICGRFDGEDYLTPFDFSIEEVKFEDVNEIITDFKEARKYLGGKPNGDFAVSRKFSSGRSVNLEDVARLVNDINPKHVKALIALNELFTIAQAWNKEDGFTPDFSDGNQTKWFPCFVYSEKTERFVFAYTASDIAATSALSGSRLCFKTSSRARKFGKQFIDLWNDALLSSGLENNGLENRD